MTTTRPPVTDEAVTTYGISETALNEWQVNEYRGGFLHSVAATHLTKRDAERVRDERIAAVNDDVIEKVRREVAAVNAPEHRPGPSRMAARRVAPGLCLECGKPWPCPESWKARAEAAEAKLAAMTGSRTVHVSIDGVPGFDGNDDLDCPYLGYVRVVPADGYIDVPSASVAIIASEEESRER